MKKAKSKKEADKLRLLKEIRQGLREVKQIQEGKAKSYSISDLFNNEEN